MVSFCLGLWLISSSPLPEDLEQNKVYLENQLQSSSTDLRISAVQKLRDLRPADLVLKLQPLLDDPKPEVRYEVIRALSRIQTPETLEILKQDLAREKDPYLLSELRRGVRGIEDFIKQAEAKAAEALQPKEPKKKPLKK